MTAETAEKVEDQTVEDAGPEVEGSDRPKDMEIILPAPGELKINGVRCKVRRLRMREFFGLMGIVTNGLGGAVAQMNWGGSKDSEEFGQLLMAAFIMAVPNQVPEFIRFVQTVVEPQGDRQDVRDVQAYLENPELEDMLPIVDAIIDNEKDSIYEFVGKAQAYLPRWQKALQR